MAEFSGLWTTDNSTPVGHQQASYTQAQLSTMLAIAAATSQSEGVAPSYKSELVPSDGGANTVNIAAGGAVVDGKFYDNSATLGVNIPSAGAGTVRKDRVVLRADWANFQVTLTRLAGTAVSYPSITQTPGTTYDITIAQVEVDDAGNVTVVDERDWATHPVDNTTIENSAGDLRVKDGGIGEAKIATNAVTAAKIAADAVGASEIAAGAVGTSELANDSVDDTKAGNRVPQFYRRKGGSATNWATPGTTTQTPGAVRMQGGVQTITFASAATEGTTTITFPQGYSNPPIVQLTVEEASLATHPMVVFMEKPTSASVVVHIRFPGSIQNPNETFTVDVHWLAIGPE